MIICRLADLLFNMSQAIYDTSLSDQCQVVIIELDGRLFVDRIVLLPAIEKVFHRSGVSTARNLSRHLKPCRTFIAIWSSGLKVDGPCPAARENAVRA